MRGQFLRPIEAHVWWIVQGADWKVGGMMDDGCSFCRVMMVAEVMRGEGIGKTMKEST